MDTQLNSERHDNNSTVAGIDIALTSNAQRPGKSDSRVPSSTLSRPISGISKVKIGQINHINSEVILNAVGMDGQILIQSQPRGEDEEKYKAMSGSGHSNSPPSS